MLARPKDFLGLILVSAAAMTVIVNALFLQAGPHPAPIFANPSPAASETTSSSATASLRPRRTESSGSKADFSGPTGKSGPIGKPAAVPVATTVARHDPIGQLLEPSNRLMAVQRALAEFGYGQIKATGIAGPETKAAIEKFERDRKLPVTGQMSERLTRELAAMKGGPI